jgi:hypothetical protein
MNSPNLMAERSRVDAEEVAKIKLLRFARRDAAMAAALDQYPGGPQNDSSVP